MQWKTLAVDLDDTLMRSDILIETGFAYLNSNLFRLYRTLIWFARGGKAHLTAQSAAATHVDVATLPYDSKVIEWLKRDALVREFGNKGFDYAGNSRILLAYWCRCLPATLGTRSFRFARSSLVGWFAIQATTCTC